MRRRKIASGTVSDRSDTQPAGGMSAFLSEAPAPRAPRSRGLSELALAVLEAEARGKTGKWDDARPTAFVGLYALCHRLVFKCLPGELESKVEFKGALRLAGQMHARFEYDGEEVASFIRWTWEREQRREKFAASKGETRDFRIGYRLQFSPRMVTDWQVDRERTKAVRR